MVVCQSDAPRWPGLSGLPGVPTQAARLTCRFSGIPKIAELRGRFGAISALLRQMVLDDFRRLGVGKDGTGEQVLEQVSGGKSGRCGSR